ncbi:MAG: hypothetical protein U0802_25930 [Candidatus Binatia bacterium]
MARQGVGHRRVAADQRQLGGGGTRHGGEGGHGRAASHAEAQRVCRLPVAMARTRKRGSRRCTELPALDPPARSRAVDTQATTSAASAAWPDISTAQDHRAQRHPRRGAARDREQPEEPEPGDHAVLAGALRLSAETLYLQAGVLDPRDLDESDAVRELRRDPHLTERQRETVVEVYKAFRRSNRETE